MIPCHIGCTFASSFIDVGALISVLLLESLPKTIIIQEMASSSDSNSLRSPLELSGSLDSFRFEESTPTIGREYIDVNLVKDILDTEDGDALVRDLAITSKLRAKCPTTQYLC